MAALFIMKFGSDQMKTVGVAFWYFQPHMVLCWQKFPSATIFFLILADR